MRTTAKMRALIVGGGIGGLTTARALRRADIEATVFERADDPRTVEAGGGIILWHNALRAFGEVGLADRVRSAGPEIEHFEFRSWRGGLIAHWPVAEMARQFGAPTIGVNRADLYPKLIEALEEGTVRFDVACVGFEQDAAGVTARFADGREERGDLLIGADGIRSTIRAQLLGPAKPRYAGYSLWQASIPLAHPAAPDGYGRVLWGRGARFVYHHVAGGRIYWTAIDHGAEGQRGVEDWRKEQLLERFRGWQEPTTTLIAATAPDALSRLDVYDRPPTSRWGEGRVTLLGDAAHPMAPNVGQGAAQAAEDAVVLARCLRAATDVPAALRAYEAQRMGRTAAMIKESRTVGTLGQWRNPLLCAARDRVLSVALNGSQLKRHKQDMAYQF